MTTCFIGSRAYISLTCHVPTNIITTLFIVKWALPYLIASALALRRPISLFLVERMETYLFGG